MSDYLDLTGNKPEPLINLENEQNSKVLESNVPNYEFLNAQLKEASLLVDDIVLKKYLTRLTDFEIIPLDDSLKQISDIRLFKINEMVYQKNEYSTYKFASVFNSVQNLNCTVFIIADSDGKKQTFIWECVHWMISERRNH